MLTISIVDVRIYIFSLSIY